MKKCPYCDFNSHVASDRDEEAYIDALLKDLEADLQLPGVSTRKVISLFIGGGTPSLFSGKAIERLLSGVFERVDCDGAEITLEANPGSADSRQFDAYRQAGVNRLSIGIQSFDDARLQVLGRVHDSAEALKAIDKARGAGFDNLNIDLMYGLPDQSMEQALEDLSKAIAMQPEHLSWYQLTLEPNTPFYHSPPSGIADNDYLADLSLAGISQLQEAGYSQYEVSAYAQTDRSCRHNKNYWLFGDYLGIGAGAHAKVTLTDGKVVRRLKQRHPQRYLAAVDAGNALSSNHTLDASDLSLEFMMNALRINAGFTRQLFEQRTGLPFSVINEKLMRLVEMELMQLNGDLVGTTSTGRHHLDTLLLEFS